MRGLKIILASVLLVNLFSCRPSCCVDYSIDVSLKVLDSNGKNLLADPAVYTKNNIETYNVTNGNARINLGSMNAPEIVKDVNGEPYLRLFLHFDRNEKRSLTLIKFGDKTTDTIAGEFKYSGNSVLLQKVWFNGVLKSPSFIVVK